nr:thioredoxin domain-containing protein [Thermincola potens]
MEPVIMALKEKYGRQVEFIVADVDDPQGNTLAAEFQVDAIPNFRFIDAKGNVVQSYTGVTTQKTLEKYIQQLLPDK